MQTTYIREEFLNDIEIQKDVNKWLNDITVSSKSKYKDDDWYLDGCEIYPNHLREIHWNNLTPQKNDLKNYPKLYDSIKKSTFFMQTTIVTGRVYKSISQIRNYYFVTMLSDWMIEKNIFQFNLLTEQDFKNYVNSILERGISKETLRHYLYPIRFLYLYKDYLEDSVQMDFFNSSFARQLMKSVERGNSSTTNIIPNEILEDILSTIIPIIDYLDSHNYTYENISQQNLIKNVNLHELLTLINMMTYFLIGLYSGLRMSEALSIKKNCLEITNDNVVLLKSTLYKTSNRRSGQEEKWAIGLNNDNNYALKAIKILEKLSPIEHKNLFFTFYNKQYITIKTIYLNEKLNTLMDFCEVEWKMASHQLRRTFAYLIGATDKTNLLALQQHFKHASISMTSYYVGQDLELLKMIEEDKQIEITQGLEEMLNSPNLAGKLGEKISKNNLKFRGKAGKELRENYIQELLLNSDLIIMPHQYGFCIYEPEAARCKGEQKNIGLNTCVKCSNFSVSEKHIVFWKQKISEQEQFYQEVKELPNQENTLQELSFEINEAKNIVNKISGGNNESTS